MIIVPRYYKKRQSDMDPRDPKTLDSVMQNRALDTILSKAKLLEKFNLALTRALPTKLLMHCNIMNYEMGIVVLSVDNASWVTRLRYDEHSLLNAFQNDPSLPNVLGFKYKVSLTY